MFIKKRALALAVTMIFIVCNALASEIKQGLTADEALKKLKDGNARFMKDDKEYIHWGKARRKQLEDGQHPFAIILTCSDSRVPPEHIFDQELGDIFVVRVAGNVAGSIELGSIEYAAEHLNVPLIMVMGHRSCGAVSAAVKGGEPEGNIRAIVKKINPAVKAVKKKAEEGNSLLNAAIEKNVELTVRSLTKNSSILKHLVESGKLKIVSAVYDLSGKVEILDSENKVVLRKTTQNH